jgi:hypothetical protein
MSRGGKRRSTRSGLREAARKSAEVRRRKRERQQETRSCLTGERALAALRRALDGSNMAAMTAAAKALLDLPSADPRTSWATVYRIDELLTRIARLELTVASLKIELKRQGAEVDDVELDDHVDELIRIFAKAMRVMAADDVESALREEGRREVTRLIADDERVAIARPGPELLRARRTRIT